MKRPGKGNWGIEPESAAVMIALEAAERSGGREDLGEAWIITATLVRSGPGGVVRGSTRWRRLVDEVTQAVQCRETEDWYPHEPVPTPYERAEIALGIDRMRRILEGYDSTDVANTCALLEIFGVEWRTRAEIADIDGVTTTTIANRHEAILDRLARDFNAIRKRVVDQYEAPAAAIHAIASGMARPTQSVIDTPPQADNDRDDGPRERAPQHKRAAGDSQGLALPGGNRLHRTGDGEYAIETQDGMTTGNVSDVAAAILHICRSARRPDDEIRRMPGRLKAIDTDMREAFLDAIGQSYWPTPERNRVRMHPSRTPTPMTPPTHAAVQG